MRECEAHAQRALAVAVNSTLPPSWLPDAEWADSLEESLLTAGFPVNVVSTLSSLSNSSAKRWSCPAMKNISTRK